MFPKCFQENSQVFSHPTKSSSSKMRKTVLVNTCHRQTPPRRPPHRDSNRRRWRFPVNLARAGGAALGLGDGPTIGLVPSAELGLVLQPTLGLAVNVGPREMVALAFGLSANFLQQLGQRWRQTQTQISLVVDVRYRGRELSGPIGQRRRHLPEVVGQRVRALRVTLNRALGVQEVFLGGRGRWGSRVVALSALGDVHSDAQSFQHSWGQRG